MTKRPFPQERQNEPMSEKRKIEILTTLRQCGLSEVMFSLAKVLSDSPEYRSVIQRLLDHNEDYTEMDLLGFRFILMSPNSARVCKIDARENVRTTLGKKK